MSASLLYLATSLMLLSGPSCQDSVSPEEGPPAPSVPLTEDEKRLVLRHLVHIESDRAELSVLRDYLRRERELAQKETTNNDKALELAKQEADLVRRELALEKERSEFYRNAYEVLKAGRSKKCIFLKVISLTLWPCK